MKVAYITSYNADDVTQWSGTGYYIAESLTKQGVELIKINCSVNFSLLQRIQRKLIKFFSNKELQLHREPAYLKKIAATANQKLSQTDYDLIFSPGSLPIAYLKTDKPIVFFTDATYDCLMSLYLLGKELSKRSREQGHLAEASAIKNASMIIYTSAWAKESALKNYNGEEHKIHLLNLGANMTCAKSANEILQMIKTRIQKKEKNFLFIGVDWQRKGAKKAIETVARLNDNGIPASLTIVGCQIPKNFQLPTYVTYYPFISKADKSGKEFLCNLFEKADFFILPTLADCTPIVFSEAASFGLPVLTTDVGGCASVVIDDVTGFCFKETNFVVDAVAKIAELCTSPNNYESISLNAYKRFKEELNWDVIGKRTVNALEQLLKSDGVIKPAC